MRVVPAGTHNHVVGPSGQTISMSLLLSNTDRKRCDGAVVLTNKLARHMHACKQSSSTDEITSTSKVHK